MLDRLPPPFPLGTPMASAKIIHFPASPNQSHSAGEHEPTIDGVMVVYHFTDGSSSYDITGYYEQHPFFAIQASAGLGAIAQDIWNDARSKK